MTAQPRAHRRARRIAWLAVVALVVAAFAPNVLALTGAIYTSNFDGSIINENTNYAAKADVYLTGGPCGGGSHLPDGDYYFQVTSPSGTLLSTDAIEEREFSMSGGFITSAQGHATNPVNCSPPVTGITVQLIPFADTPNNGNEYKLHVATKESVEACPLFDETSSTFVFCNGADQKSDNFKVGADPATPTPTPVVTPTPTPTPTPVVTPTPTPTPTPVVTPTPTPVVTPTPPPSPTGGVGGATGTPAGSVDPTLPPTSTLDGGSGGTGDSWRVVLLAMAGILAAALLLTPARAVVRKDDIAR